MPSHKETDNDQNKNDPQHNAISPDKPFEIDRPFYNSDFAVKEMRMMIAFVFVPCNNVVWEDRSVLTGKMYRKFLDLFRFGLRTKGDIGCTGADAIG
jgi:hypothetical protein